MCDSVDLLYVDAPLEVEEGHILAFHFSNFTLRDLYVYIFCLEETGQWIR